MRVRCLALVAAGLFAMPLAAGLALAQDEESEDGGWQYHEATADRGAAALYVGWGGEWNPLGVECRDGRIVLAMEDGPSPDAGDEGDVIAYRILVDGTPFEVPGQLGPLNQMNHLHRFTAELDAGADILNALIRGRTATVHHGAEEVSDVSLAGSAEAIRGVVGACTNG